MQLLLELLSDSHTTLEESIDRVLANECGRVAGVVFESVKNLHPKKLAVETAEQLIAEKLTMCTSKQACEVI